MSTVLTVISNFDKGPSINYVGRRGGGGYPNAYATT